MVEDKTYSKCPSIRIDGHTIFKINAGNTFEHLQDIVSKKWAELNSFAKHRQ